MQGYNYLSNEVPREIINVYSDLQNEVLKTMVNGLQNGISPDDIFIKMQEVINGFKEQQDKVVSVVFADSRKKVVKDNEKAFKDEPDKDKKAVTLKESTAIVIPSLIGAFSIIDSINGKLLGSAVNSYRENYYYLQQPATRLMDARKRTEAVYKHIAKNGIPIREGVGGRSRDYSLENIVRRDVIYKLNQANAEISKDNFNKSSAKFIEVSSHPTARTWNKYMKHAYEDHSSWQGKVYYSRDGERVQGYDEFETACGYGEMLGICGINCYHQFELNYDGKQHNEKYQQRDVKKLYKLTQEQRQLERYIRQSKQEMAVYKEAGLKDNYLRAKDRMNNATDILKAFCEKNNLKYDNWRTKI